MEQVRPQLIHLLPLVRVLDGVEYTLDPITAESEDISSAIEGSSQRQNVCLLAISRVAVNTPGFYAVGVILPGGRARQLLHHTLPQRIILQARTSALSLSVCSPGPCTGMLGVNRGHCWVEGRPDGCG